MNMLYLHTHDSGRYLQPYGYPVSTPNLMEFAKKSTLFRHCYTTAPTCSPSRAGLLTGTYPHSNGMLGLAHLGFGLNDMSKHLVSYLNSNGYETALSGIQHVAANVDDIGYSKVLHDKTDVKTNLSDPEVHDLHFANLAAKYIKSKSDKKGNFFLSFGMFNTHRPFPSNRDEINPNYVMPPAVIYDNKENREDMSDYHYSAKVADQCVGIVLDALKEANLEDDTVIFFTTDHGIAFPRMKCNLYDTGTGIALILKYPQNPKSGTALDSLVSNIDVFPTLCDICNLPKPDWLQGVSLMPLLKGEKIKIRNEVYSEVNYHVDYEPMRSIRTKRFKLIKRYNNYNKIVPDNIDTSTPKRFLEDSGWLDQTNEREMLFDMYLDPVERINVVDVPEYKEIYNDLSAKLSKWMEETNDPLINTNHHTPNHKNSNN